MSLTSHDTKETKPTVEMMLDELLRCTRFEPEVDPGLIREPAPEDMSSNHSSLSSSPSRRFSSVSTSAMASSRRVRSGKARHERERKEPPDGEGDGEDGEEESAEERKKKPSAIEYWLRMNAARELLSDALGKLVTARQRDTAIRERARHLGITPAEEQSAPTQPAQSGNTNNQDKGPDTNANANANPPQKPKPKPLRCVSKSRMVNSSVTYALYILNSGI